MYDSLVGVDYAVPGTSQSLSARSINLWAPSVYLLIDCSIVSGYCCANSLTQRLTGRARSVYGCAQIRPCGGFRMTIQLEAPADDPQRLDRFDPKEARPARWRNLLVSKEGAG